MNEGDVEEQEALEAETAGMTESLSRRRKNSLKLCLVVVVEEDLPPQSSIFQVTGSSKGSKSMLTSIGVSHMRCP